MKYIPDDFINVVKSNVNTLLVTSIPNVQPYVIQLKFTVKRKETIAMQQRAIMPTTS